MEQKTNISQTGILAGLAELVPLIHSESCTVYE